MKLSTSSMRLQTHFFTRHGLSVVLISFGLCWTIAILSLNPATQRTTEGNSGQKPVFVSSEVCKTCHLERFQTWLQTAHAYSLREPTEENVAGHFDGKPIETPYFQATPYRREGRYWMRVEGRDGRPSSDSPISRIVGKSFEQAYLFTGPKGEWRVLPICWSLERKQWDLTDRVLADINGDAKSIPENFDTRMKIFNDGCGQCHATDYAIGYDDRSEQYTSQMLEGAVACESCHGPGSLHVAWHRTKKSATSADYVPPNRLLHPAKDLNAREVLATCGRCHYKHGWRYAIDDDPRIGFNEIAVSQNYDGMGFLPDGRLSGLNYHGSTQSQSACFRGGMSCLSCHQMHGGYPRALKREATSDEPCAQCHRQLVANSKPHTHHQDLRCVDCHMPKLVTGVLHFMRDHSLGSPEPELTERYGKEASPNACNLCHKAESAGWARQWKEKWWRPAERNLVQNVGLVVEMRRGSMATSKALANLAENSEDRLFFRLTAIRNLGNRRDEISRQSLRGLLNDSHEEIRQLACMALAEDPHPEAAAVLLPLLKDPVRTVRLEAAFALVRSGWRGNNPELERSYSDAVHMLERQRSFNEILERLVPLADVLGKSAAMSEWFSVLARRSEQPWTMPDLLQRYGRLLLEAGKAQDAFNYFNQALDGYHRLPGAFGAEMEQLLFLDLADALDSLNRQSEAQSYWRYLARHSRPGSIPQKIANSRLPGETAADERKNALSEAMRDRPWARRTLAPGSVEFPALGLVQQQ